MDPALKDVLDFDFLKELAELVWYYFSFKRSSTGSITLVLTFCNNCPTYLVEHVSNLLKSEDLELSDESFRNCSRFWSSTQLNHDYKIDKFRYALVGTMCSYLDSSSPLHRFSAKGWIYSVNNL